MKLVEINSLIENTLYYSREIDRLAACERVNKRISDAMLAGETVYWRASHSQPWDELENDEIHLVLMSDPWKLKLEGESYPPFVVIDCDITDGGAYRFFGTLGDAYEYARENDLQTYFVESSIP